MTPALTTYLNDMQSKAVLLESLLGTVNACLDFPERKNLAISVVESAREIADELQVALDSVNRPEGKQYDDPRATGGICRRLHGLERDGAGDHHRRLSRFGLRRTRRSRTQSRPSGHGPACRRQKITVSDLESIGAPVEATPTA